MSFMKLFVQAVSAVVVYRTSVFVVYVCMCVCFHELESESMCVAGAGS